MILQTERLRLRPISKEDKVSIFEYRSDLITNEYQSWIPKTIFDVEEFIEKTASKTNLPGTWFQIVISDKKTKKIIGDVGIHFFKENSNQVEIGCTLNKNFHGKGYATEALQEVTEYLFNDLKKKQIFGFTHPENTNSINLLKRLGFKNAQTTDDKSKDTLQQNIDLKFIKSQK